MIRVALHVFPRTDFPREVIRLENELKSIRESMREMVEKKSRKKKGSDVEQEKQPDMRVGINVIRDVSARETTWIGAPEVVVSRLQDQVRHLRCNNEIRIEVYESRLMTRGDGARVLPLLQITVAENEIKKAEEILKTLRLPFKAEVSLVVVREMYDVPWASGIPRESMVEKIGKWIREIRAGVLRYAQNIRVLNSLWQ